MARPAISRSGLTGAFQRFWARSYAPDYVGIVLLIAGHAVLWILFEEPFHRMFSLDMTRLAHPHAEQQRVPPPWLFGLGGALPLVVLILWAILLRPGAHKAHVTILGFFISVLFTSFLTDVFKNAIGRPRPDLIARCKPRLGTPAHELVSYHVCTETNHHLLHDGFRSFPSGHSSFAFSGLGYLSFFFASQFQVLRPRSNLFKVILVMAPLLGSVLVAISRLEDYRHDIYDVTTGSLLGEVIAWLSWRAYYPALRSPRCDEPYPPRGDAILDERRRKARDEEARIGDAAEFELEDTEDEAESVPLRGQRH